VAPIPWAEAPTDEEWRRGYHDALAEAVGRLEEALTTFAAGAPDPRLMILGQRVGIERAIAIVEALRQEKLDELW
jgi:hypothetical protein